MHKPGAVREAVGHLVKGTLEHDFEVGSLALKLLDKATAMILLDGNLTEVHARAAFIRAFVSLGRGSGLTHDEIASEMLEALEASFANPDSGQIQVDQKR